MFQPIHTRGEREPLMLNNGDQVLYIDGLTITDATGVQVTNVGID